MTATTLLRAALPRRSGFLLLFSAAVLVRLFYSLAVQADGLTWADEITYDRIAWGLVETGRYVSEPYDAAPGWPAVLAVTYGLFGHHYDAARALQALLGGVLVLAVAGTGSRFFDRRTGYIAGLMTALYPPLIYLAAVLYADHLAAVLLALTIWSIARWQRNQRALLLIVPGVLLGLVALTRPVYLLLVPAVAAYVGVQATAGQRIRGAALVTAVALVTITPWTIRNIVVFDHFVPVSTGFGLHLWRGNNEVALGDADDRHLLPLNELWLERAAAVPVEQRAPLLARTRELAAALHQLDPVEQDARLGAEAWRWIRTHPTRFAELALGRLETLYSPFSKTRTRNDAGSARNVRIAALSLLTVLALGIPGAVLAFRAQRASWIVHATILTPTLLYCVLTAATRFRLPIDALWILLASVTAVMLFDRVLQHSTHEPAVARRRAAGAAC